jgi:CBS domain-containing protein/RimJ/RimL family protein N-acetyltransferase
LNYSLTSEIRSKDFGGLSLTECSIFQHPRAFIDKHKDPQIIMPLDERRHEKFRAMFFTEMPRTSLNGVPPLKDDACNAWINQIMFTGTNLIAVNFGGEIVGSSALFPMNDLMWEILINVVPSFRNKGIGTQLALCAIELAYEAGVNKIWLSVDAQNVVARHIYLKSGFEYIGNDGTGEMSMILELVRLRQTETISIETILNKNVISIKEDALCCEAIKLFLKNRIGALPVVDDTNTLVGILSETDLIVEINFNKRVSDVMTKDVISVRDEYSVAKVVRLFRCKKLRCFPVINSKKKLIGVIGRRDILELFASMLLKKNT